MVNIIIPNKFKIKLEKNQLLSGIVNTTLSHFGEILIDNKLYFFEEYTNHGKAHIESVLLSSEKLITDETYEKVLKETDVAYYVLAVILHDIGMHIGLDGFKSLIEGKFDDIRIQEFDSKTWKELWEEYISEAKRFSEKQLKGIFGKEQVIIENPPLHDSGLINSDHRKLIGEFLRRNHPRLAHEIAISGFPSKSKPLKFAQELSTNVRNLIGLVARSHGLDVRSCIDYIEKKYSKSIRLTPEECHVIFLMILLRTSDFIQISSDRVSKTVLKLKTFSSPISELEHESHLAIDMIDDAYQSDPERIFVNASPKDSIMFLKLKKLFQSIQYEFDVSWAIIGEFYGLHNIKPAIKYRRITSNLEESDFISKQNYVAQDCSFKANEDILKLLVGPLYGDDPKYGIRELIQNAVDACREREVIENSSKYFPQIKVEVIKNDDSFYFVISDNGIGMNIDVIRNYFLTAGASFRKSSDWQKDFINDDGSVKVNRNGRFGIGILAAFLIGKEIYIETKKINSNIGYKFSGNLNTNSINILKDTAINEGTLIQVRIKQDVLKRLNPKEEIRSSDIKWYQWYKLKSPKISYWYLGEKIAEPNIFYPSLNEPRNDFFEVITSLGYEKIYWTYFNKYNTWQNKTICNGIVIPNQTYGVIKTGLIRSIPHLSIFDNSGSLPLSLDRNSLSGVCSFSNDLKIDIYKDYIACLLCFDNIPVFKGKEKSRITLKSQFLNHDSFSNDLNFPKYGFGAYDFELFDSNRSLINHILFNKEGYILNYNFFINQLTKINVLFIQSESVEDLSINLDLKNVFLYYYNTKINSIDDYKSAIEPNNFDVKTNSFRPLDVAIYLKSQAYDYLFGLNSNKKRRVSEWLNSKCKLVKQEHNWAIIHLDSPKDSIIKSSFLNKYSDKINFMREYSITCEFEGDKDFNELLQKYIGNDVVIPFDLETRKKKYPLAFKELANYMKKHQKEIKDYNS